MTSISKKNRKQRSQAASEQARRDPAPTVPAAKSDSRWRGLGRKPLLAWLAGGCVLGGAFVWAYWPTVVEMVGTWNREPDYSHGFLVVPAAAFLLWVRRDHFPWATVGIAWLGLVLVASAAALRVVSAHLYMNAIDGWSIPLWVAGAVWLLAGGPVCRWSLPGVGFLFFMIPLPYRVERWFSLPLQRIATKMSCWVLQCLGLPAIARANTIQLGACRLEVEQACSGLRIFVGILALACACVILVRRTPGQRALLLLSAIPIALIANSARVVGTALCHYHFSGETARWFSHEVAGWVMIPFAAALFAGFWWYLGKLLPEEELVDLGAALRRRRD